METVAIILCSACLAISAFMYRRVLHLERAFFDASDRHLETLRRWKESIDKHKQFYRFVREVHEPGSRLKTHEIIHQATTYELDAQMINIEEYLAKKEGRS